MLGLQRLGFPFAVLLVLASGSVVAAGFPVEEISIEQLHAAYRSGKTNAAEVVQQHLNRIAAYDKQGPLLNSLITVNPKALEEAAALDVKFKQTGKFVGPLHGVPVIIKDNVDVFGMPMSSGFQGWKNYMPPSDATLAKRFAMRAPSLLLRHRCRNLRAAAATTSTRY